MGTAATENLTLMFGLIGVVVVIAALLSGFIERSNFPQVAVFLGLGAAIGPFGFGLLDVGLDSPMLRMVATLSLALVLFTDALTIDIGEVKKHAGLASLVLIPGTLIAAGLITLAGIFVLDLPVAMAAILAAPLASTDPVILRGLLKRPDLPSAARQALRLESGLNDIVLLPLILVAMTIAVPAVAGEEVSIFKLLLQMLVVGPGLGALVAWVGISLLSSIRKKIGVRRDYESLYSIGIALAAFAAAEAFHGSGFLAVFAAGLMISSIDVELCDCFREYGETTAEILLLFTFVLLGTSLIWTGLSMVTVAVGVFVALALLARPVTLVLALWKTKTQAKSKQLIIWFGPRGLSTLLLILVPIFAGTPGTSPLFHVASVVVLVSVAIHGGSIMILGHKIGRQSRRDIPVEAATLPVPVVEDRQAPPRMNADDLLGFRGDGREIRIFDVRREPNYLASTEAIEGTERLHPQFARRDAEQLGLAKDAWIAVFCACPHDATSERVAEELRTAGWRNAFAIQGGWDSLEAAGFRVVHKEPAG